MIGSLGACVPESNNSNLRDLPFGFPEMEIPEDNHRTEARLALGSNLFFDPIMSDDKSISCASCHRPELVFADTMRVSPGSAGKLGTRNVPSLINIGYLPYFTRDGGVPTLEMQVFVPIDQHNEFNFSMAGIVGRMKDSPMYVDMCEKAYGREPDAFCVTRSLAAFQRELIGGKSAYDAFLAGDTAAIGASAKRGMELFFSKEIGCTNCHGGFLFTDHTFQNNGLYNTYADSGRFRVTMNELDRATFKVPSLRNVAVTAPYMHDGSVETLQGVLEHYSTGVENHQNKSELVEKLELDSTEKADLEEFLKSLTDSTFVSLIS